MNGRVYDYNLGRFLSVDPFIQAPGNSQSLNPYSYIMNNPLAGTDPSAYIADCFLSISCENQSLGNPFNYPSDCPFCVSTTGAAPSNGATGNNTSAETPANIGGPQDAAGGVSDGRALAERDPLESQIKADAKTAIAQVGETLGADIAPSEKGIDAKWGRITRSENGNITNAQIICDLGCQLEGANRWKITSQDIAMTAMRSSYLHSQRELAEDMYTVVEYSSLPFLVGEIAAASVARVAFLTASERSAYFGLVAEAAALTSGVDGSAGFVMKKAKSIIPRMKVPTAVGKPKVKISKDGKYIVE